MVIFETSLLLIYLTNLHISICREYETYESDNGYSKACNRCNLSGLVKCPIHKGTS